MSKQSSQHPDDKPRAPGHARRAKPYGLKCYACLYGQTVWSYTNWYATPEARATARKKRERATYYVRLEEIER